MARQLVDPNFSIVENAGWCLQYARRVFSAPAVESTAWQGWMMTEHPHEDRNFPEGVATPVWFDWKGDVGDGHIFRYGHVAVRAKDGKIWSSPLSGRGSTRFNSVDDLTRAFGNGMKYVGWSEDISNVKVVEIGETMVLDTDLEYARWEKLGRQIRGRSLTRDEFRSSAVGRTWLQAIEVLSDDAEADEALKDQELGHVARRDDWEGQINGLLAEVEKKPMDTSDAEKKLQSIKDALDIK
jgi:hypothetical protein